MFQNTASNKQSSPTSLQQPRVNDYLALPQGSQERHTKKCYYYYYYYLAYMSLIHNQQKALTAICQEVFTGFSSEGIKTNFDKVKSSWHRKYMCKTQQHIKAWLTLMTHTALWLKRIWKNEVECSKRVEVRKAEILAVGEVRKATFWPSPALKAEETLIYRFAEPHRR